MTAPKYATRRNPENPTFGPRIASVAAFLGGSLMPWQQQVADVALELDPRNPGAWRYPVVVVTVPRQAGKSFLLRAIMVDRMMSYNNREILMTAQTGKDARKRWKQISAALHADKRAAFKVYASQGSERLEYVRRGSFIAPFAPTPKSIHGDSLHLVTVDEAWAFNAESGLALETAINPTQLTIKDSQLWIVSTKGTSDSAYLNELIRAGRQAVNDPNASMCFFEWSADEAAAAADPYSDETLSFHPAVGHTQTLDKIRALATGDVSSWRRSILNLETATETTCVDMAIFDSLACEADVERPSHERVAIAFDVAYDRSGATIAAAWVDDDGDLKTTLIATRPGVDWVIPVMNTLARAGYKSCSADSKGPTLTIVNDLNDKGARIASLKPADYAAACQLFIDRVKDGALTHTGDAELREAIEKAETRIISGVTAFDPTKSAGPIDALRATAIAIWAASQRTPERVPIF